MHELTAIPNKESKLKRELQVAYMAGVLDSDGWVTIHKNVKTKHCPVYSPRMGLNQVEPQAIELAFSLFGGKVGKVNYDKDSYNRFSRKPMFTWTIGSDGLIEAVSELIPFLRIKKKQAELVLSLQMNIRKFKSTRAIKGIKRGVLTPDTIEFREKCYQNLRIAHSSTVAETEREETSQARYATVLAV